MKDTSDALLHPEQAAYLERLEPARDELLAEMERLAADAHHPISDPEVAAFLAVTVRASGAKRMIELGTNIGYGAIVMARAGGQGARVLTIEKSHDLCEVARGYARRAGLETAIDVREGAAIEVLEKTSPGPGPRPDEGAFDLAYIDCVKEEYPRYFELLLPRLARGGVLVADNVLWRGLVASDIVPESERARVAALRHFNHLVTTSRELRGVVLPLGDGVAYAVKL